MRYRFTATLARFRHSVQDTVPVNRFLVGDAASDCRPASSRVQPEFPCYCGCAVRRRDRVSKAPENGRFRDEDYHDKDSIYVAPADELAGARELWVGSEFI